MDQPAWHSTYVRCLNGSFSVSAVTTLATGAAPLHLQDGGTDTQGPDDIGAVILQRHAPHSATSETAPIIRLTSTYHPMHLN